jgi:hypothetical protein
MVPSSAFQVTDVLEDVPCVVAIKESVPEVTDDALEGATVTRVTPEFGGWLGAALPSPTQPETQSIDEASKDISTKARFLQVKLIVSLFVPKANLCGVVRST